MLSEERRPLGVTIQRAVEPCQRDVVQVRRDVYTCNEASYRFNGTFTRCNEASYRFNGTFTRCNEALYRFNGTFTRCNEASYRFDETFTRAMRRCTGSTRRLHGATRRCTGSTRCLHGATRRCTGRCGRTIRSPLLMRAWFLLQSVEKGLRLFRSLGPGRTPLLEVVFGTGDPRAHVRMMEPELVRRDQGRRNQFEGPLVRTLQEDEVAGPDTERLTSSGSVVLPFRSRVRKVRAERIERKYHFPSTWTSSLPPPPADACAGTEMPLPAPAPDPPPDPPRPRSPRPGGPGPPAAAGRGAPRGECWRGTSGRAG